VQTGRLFSWLWQPLLQPHWPAGLFLLPMTGLVVEHPLGGAAAAAAFLSADLFDARALGIDVTFFERLDLIEQEPARQIAIEALRTRGLALDLETCRAVKQHHARGGLVDVLAAVTAGTDERLFNVGFPHAERGHALRQLDFLLGTDRERAHAPSVTGSRRKDNGEMGFFVAARVAGRYKI
jgi:hypothetical protein